MVRTHAMGPAAQLYRPASCMPRRLLRPLPKIWAQVVAATANGARAAALNPN